MAQYQFLDKDGNAVSLDQVDKEICEVFGAEYDKETYNVFFNFAVELGFGILMSQNGFKIDVKMMDDYCKYKREKMKDKDEQQIIEFFDFVDRIQSFLDGTKYQFNGWR